MERCRHTGVKPPFRDTEDTDTQTPQPHSDTCCDRAPGPHVDLCGGVGHTAKALRGDTHGDIPTYALVSTLTHTHTATRREAHTGFADSKTHGQFLTLLDLMCVLCLQGEPGDPGEDGRKVSCPRLESALAQTGAGGSGGSVPSSQHCLPAPVASGSQPCCVPPEKHPETGTDKPFPPRPAPAADYTLKIAAGRDVLKIKNF